VPIWRVALSPLIVMDATVPLRSRGDTTILTEPFPLMVVPLREEVIANMGGAGIVTDTDGDGRRCTSCVIIGDGVGVSLPRRQPRVHECWRRGVPHLNCHCGTRYSQQQSARRPSEVGLCGGNRLSDKARGCQWRRG